MIRGPLQVGIVEAGISDIEGGGVDHNTPRGPLQVGTVEARINDIEVGGVDHNTLKMLVFLY